MAQRSFREGRIVRFAVGRRRLLLSLAAGLLLFAMLPDRLYPATRFIFAWDLMTALYVSVTLSMMARSTVESVARMSESCGITPEAITLR